MMYRLTKPYFNHAETDVVKAVLDSGFLAEGKVTSEFERKVAEYVGAKHAVAVCNCTAAMTLCLKAEGVTHESVLIPDFTHPATALAVLNAGCRPLLCDVSLETYNLVNGSYNTMASIPVSWAGNPLTEYPRTMIVEDAACSLGSSVNGKMTGCEFTTCFSFHPRKIVTCGEGAVVTTNDAKLAEKLRNLKTFGEGGGNYKLNDVASAIGSAQMDKIEQVISRRREMAHVYSDLLREVKGVKAPEEPRNARHTWQTYAVLLETADRDKVIQNLGLKGIETQIGTYALHLMPQFNRLRRVNKLTNSEILYRRLLALPMSYDLTFDDQKRVVAELKSVIAES